MSLPKSHKEILAALDKNGAQSFDVLISDGMFGLKSEDSVKVALNKLIFSGFVDMETVEDAFRNKREIFSLSEVGQSFLDEEKPKQKYKGQPAQPRYVNVFTPEMDVNGYGAAMRRALTSRLV